MARRRDAQKFRVYAAEREWRGKVQVARFASEGEMQEFVNMVHRWVVQDIGITSRGHKLFVYFNAGSPRVMLAPRRAHSQAWLREGVLSITKHDEAYNWTDHMLLHELAHLYTAAAGHEPRWVAFYLLLVRKFLGPALTTTLIEEFKKRKVRYTMPRPSRRRSLTPSEREVFVERMRIARENKRLEVGAA